MVPIATKNVEKSAGGISTLDQSRKVYNWIMSTTLALRHQTRDPYRRLQSIRLEVIAFTSVSLLLLMRESLRKFSIPGLTQIKVVAFAMLIGILVASW